MPSDDPPQPPPGNAPGPPSEPRPTGGFGPLSGEPLSEIFGLDAVGPGRDPLIGVEIGGVKIIRLIAQGGMGRVYEGLQHKPGRTVAVKVMRPGLATPSMMKRFEYEAEILGRLRHPCIAQIFAAGVHQVAGAPVPFFIMEYIPDARPITTYAADLKLTTRARLDLFRSVCDAVAHGHQRGVIHRDLKPSNILVDADGNPKVIDFGVAKATDSDLALTTKQTDLGQLVGTLQYMGPEQLTGDPKDIDGRCDVYALGVVLYELLTGRLPYDVSRKAVLEAIRIVREDEPRPISTFDRTLRRDVEVIARKCLEKKPKLRYSSVEALGEDVERHLAGEPISARPPSLLESVRRWANRKWTVAEILNKMRGRSAALFFGVGILNWFLGRFSLPDNESPVGTICLGIFTGQVVAVALTAAWLSRPSCLRSAIICSTMLTWATTFWTSNSWAAYDSGQMIWGRVCETWVFFAGVFFVSCVSRVLFAIRGQSWLLENRSVPDFVWRVFLPYSLVPLIFGGTCIGDDCPVEKLVGLIVMGAVTAFIASPPLAFVIMRCGGLALTWLGGSFAMLACLQGASVWAYLRLAGAVPLDIFFVFYSIFPLLLVGIVAVVACAILLALRTQWVVNASSSRSSPANAEASLNEGWAHI